MKQILMHAFSCLLLLVFFSCKKEGSRRIDQQSGQPKLYDHGISAGTIIKKNIGTSGGKISTPDGRFSITVPPGAVNAVTEFSIQPVSTVLELGIGKSFRLEAEHTTFNLPVEIMFKYDETDIDGTSPLSLFLTYQDSIGYWHHVPTAIDTVHRILKASTRHFSDWSARRSFALDSDKKDLFENEQAQLEVSFQDKYEAPGSQDDDLLGPVIKLGEHVKDWNLFGPGSLNATGTHAIYTAPENIPTPASAYVSAEIEGVVNKIDPEREGEGGKVIVEKRLNLGGEECKITVNGTTVIPEYATITTSGNFTTLSAQSGNAGFSFIIFGNIEQGATYDFGPAQQAGCVWMSTTMVTGNAYLSEYSNCDPLHPAKKYGTGFVKIDVWGDKDDLVEGSFSGTLYYDEPHDTKCNYQSIPVSGNFKLKYH